VRNPASLALLALLVLAASARGEDAPPPETDGVQQAAPADEDEDWLDTGPDPAERDGLERTNRGIFLFNESFYHWVADPLNRGFQWLVPEPGRRAVHRFFENLDQPAVFVNGVLQLAPLDAAKTLSRFAINTTIGLLGFFDPATPLGVPAVQTDFGETLAVYGVPSGSYVVIPLLGPSTARDTFGEIVDGVLHPTFWFASPVQQLLFRGGSGLSTYDVEHERLEALRATSVDFYAAIRGAYLMDRDARVDERIEGRWWNRDHAAPELASPAAPEPESPAAAEPVSPAAAE